MKWTTETSLIVAAATIVAIQIIFRCTYRLLGTFKLLPAIHQRWHSDDSWMAFSLVPLVSRTACIAWYFDLRAAKTHHHDVVAKKLVIPSRLAYALFLWCMKLCLLQFYSRLENGSNRVHRARRALWYFIVVSFLVIVLATLLECRPLSLYWAPTKHACQKGTKNLLTMAILNIATDLALILFPIPMLWKMSTLSFQTKVQLTLLFLVGTIVVVVTIIRLPLIFLHSNSQTTRTMWASIELVCASIVGNAAFYYALWKEIPRWRGQRPSSVPLVPYILSLEHNGSENQRAWTCPEQRLIQASTSDKTDDTSAGTPKDTLSLVETGLKGLHGST
ncbi:uncharacterized protein CIMG_03367 [Coccidioides immitis RS]|uniref:Rhodopsin domain-containing protein n=4 Tax=Coccidioides immitis TaxID=5501 RepID=J3KB71_COCIM|nr:uncharacterized protein CIMG_03367 [Coccidioides immitis RS]EAS32343.3 hypothetical protein CIMG_03367 [Coccidioides immitis RS]KMP07572.1 hypothetical protein CIRG_07253 [Coccidioides immitis RMSCC 2394]KMU71978.1 hypothetical protein CISG_00287 [Coccidioides immitis RMSCC 3703]KMU82656.1 hypothetical protein CIHG_00437 [Coccidioides immitis H538.4]